MVVLWGLDAVVKKFCTVQILFLTANIILLYKKSWVWSSVLKFVFFMLFKRKAASNYKLRVFY